MASTSNNVKAEPTRKKFIYSGDEFASTSSEVPLMKNVILQQEVGTALDEQTKDMHNLRMKRLADYLTYINSEEWKFNSVDKLLGLN